MGIIRELMDDFKAILRFRDDVMPVQKALDRKAPKVGELAPDFTLYDSTGTESVTLSQFRGKMPVALVFGSFT